MPVVGLGGVGADERAEPLVDAGAAGAQILPLHAGAAARRGAGRGSWRGRPCAASGSA